MPNTPEVRTTFAARVRAHTGGAGVAVAYDSVGRTTFDASLAALRRRGVLSCCAARPAVRCRRSTRSG